MDKTKMGNMKGWFICSLNFNFAYVVLECLINCLESAKHWFKKACDTKTKIIQAWVI